jgi:hypothetical protein
MSASRILWAAACAALVVGSPALGAELDRREYKVPLKPEIGSQLGSADAVVAYWSGTVAPALREALKGSDVAIPESPTVKRKERAITFFDNALCVLTRSDLVLRTRVDRAKNETEITLKFRTPDLAVASAAKLGDLSDKKFEEDIVPLAARNADGRETMVAQPRSMRSLFSRSGTLDRQPGTVADLVDLAKPVKDLLEEPVSAQSGPLVPGSEIAEVAYDDIEMDFGRNGKVEFSISVWQNPSAGADSERTSVEISFKTKSKNPMDLEAAQLAQTAYLALQNLGDAAPNLPPKTKAGLPRDCRDRRG